MLILATTKCRKKYIYLLIYCCLLFVVVVYCLLLLFIVRCLKDIVYHSLHVVLMSFTQ